MRKYDDPVEVRRGQVSGLLDGESGQAELVGEAPEQFLWHGRLWKVRSVLAHWVETGPWWQSAGVRAVVGTEVSTELDPQERSVETTMTGDLLAERELWRVEAGRGAGDSGGVFDLSFSWDDGRWQLVGCAD